jgi:glucans biosynthesis protein C
VKAHGGHSPVAFWKYWIGYVQCAGTFQLGLWLPERMSQMHFWFLSLLLLFFAGYCVLKGIPTGQGRSEQSRFVSRHTGRAIPATLVLAGVMTALAYFLTTLAVPDTSWLTIDLLLQFQPTGFVVYAVSFAVGCLACSWGWFAGPTPRRPFLWLPLVALLIVAFFAAGRDVFARPFTSNEVAPSLLLVFSTVRTALCLAVLILLVTGARSLGTPTSRSARRLADNSYYIYLVHLFFVVVLQHVLMMWRGGPPMAKAGVVFLIALPISYWISRVMSRFPRVFVMAFVVLFAAVALMG